MIEKIRAFICFEIAQSTQQYLAGVIAGARRLGDAISWTRAENIHLTLKFLGDIDPEQVGPIADTLSDIAGEVSSISGTIRWRIDTLGAFPNFRSPRVFWAGSRQPEETLRRLVGELENRLAGLGFPGEKRAYTPHLTLGRVRRGPCRRTSAYLQNFEFQPQEMRCEELILMRSELKPTGAEYTPLRRIMLSATV